MRIDSPGVGIVTADDEGDGEEDISASSRAKFLRAGSKPVIGMLSAQMKSNLNHMRVSKDSKRPITRSVTVQEQVIRIHY